MQRRASGVYAVVVICLWIVAFAGSAFGQSMEVVTATIQIPSDDEFHELSGLRYGGIRWAVEFTSVRCEFETSRDANPVKMVWTVTGRSAKQRPERFKMALMLVDESGKTLASAQKNGMIKAGDESYQMKLNMKAKAKQFSAATKLRIRVVFLMS
jgi:hypothetical protein